MSNVIEGLVVLKDKFTPKAKKIEQSTKTMKKGFKDVKDSSKKMRKDFTKTKNATDKLSKGFDKSNMSLNKLRSNMSRKLKVRVDDREVKKSTRSLKTLGKGILAVGTIAGTGLALGGKKLFDMGAELEQQKISMTHFLGGDKKKSEAFISKLRKNANATPFETGEVVKAGTRAVQIADGDTRKAMNYVKLAEDMAALNPGKTISDAMEALADAKKILSHIGVRIINYLWKFIPYHVIIY